MWSDDKKKKSLRELIEDAPKTLTKAYLQSLYSVLFYEKLERDIDVESLISSLLVEVIDENASASNRHFAYVILQKLQYVAGSSKIISADLGRQLIYTLPILISQDIKCPCVVDVIKKLIWCLYNENWSDEMKCYSLTFLCKAIASPDSPLSQSLSDDIRKLSSLLSSWLIMPSSVPVKSPGFRRSSSSLSITEIDGTDTHDFFTVLNYAPTITSKQFRSIYVFSMLRSYLCSSNKNNENSCSSVMHKPDSLYVYLFCDMLNLCFKDNYISYEILNLMLQNRAQLCYHSSILEKYFPTFFKVLAWRPNTFAIDFEEILPAFMSQNTSLEIFHTLLDLPCLTAILMLMDNKSCSLDPKKLRDPKLLETLNIPEITSLIKYIMRSTSGNANKFENIQFLHQTLQSLASSYRVVCCSQAVIPLLKCYFQVLAQYADTSVIVLIVPAILDRLSVIYSIENYIEEVHKVLAESIIKLFELHPETVFHCQKNILSYLRLTNYSISESSFINMVWVAGEYVSPTYSSICKPEIIASFFENLETTTYEALSLLKDSSNDQFLKFLSVILTTLSKLAARNQDHVPRAVLCLSKVHKQLKSFGNDYKKSWKIVTERVQELLSILNVPSIAAIVLSPPKDIESGRLHRDSTSLPYVLRTITDILTTEN